VRFRYDRVSLLRPNHQCIGGIGAPRKDQGHSGLADTGERDRIKEFLWAVQLLQVVHPGFFSAWSTADRSYQAWGLHMDQEIRGSL
jgi:hypothetical protein